MRPKLIRAVPLENSSATAATLAKPKPSSWGPRAVRRRRRPSASRHGSAGAAAVFLVSHRREERNRRRRSYRSHSRTTAPQEASSRRPPPGFPDPALPEPNPSHSPDHPVGWIRERVRRRPNAAARELRRQA